MARPPLPPRSHSPSVRSFCSTDDSLITADPDEEVRSDKIQDFFESFDAAERFSQVDAEGGRGTQVVREMHALLVNAWMRREEQNPELCFDKHDGRHNRTIYHPPQRQPGGIVVPGRLAGTEELAGHATQSVNIVHHHVTIRSVERHDALRDNSVRREESDSKRRKVQSTLSLSQGDQTGRRRNKGRFVRKTLVSNVEKNSTKATIPLAPSGIRDILRQWVVGDPTKGLETPLCEFTYEMINAKSPTGKSNKSLYSKRKTVSLATLLALREAFERKTSLADVLGISGDQDISKMSITAWEKYSRQYLREGRKMSRQEVLSLGSLVYKQEYLGLLPR